MRVVVPSLSSFAKTLAMEMGCASPDYPAPCPTLQICQPISRYRSIGIYIGKTFVQSPEEHACPVHISNWMIKPVTQTNVRMPWRPARISQFCADDKLNRRATGRMPYENVTRVNFFKLMFEDQRIKLFNPHDMLTWQSK